MNDKINCILSRVIDNNGLNSKVTVSNVTIQHGFAYGSVSLDYVDKKSINEFISVFSSDVEMNSCIQLSSSDTIEQTHAYRVVYLITFNPTRVNEEYGNFSARRFVVDDDDDDDYDGYNGRSYKKRTYDIKLKRDEKKRKFKSCCNCVCQFVFVLAMLIIVFSTLKFFGLS